MIIQIKKTVEFIIETDGDMEYSFGIETDGGKSANIFSDNEFTTSGAKIQDIIDTIFSLLVVETGESEEDLEEEFYSSKNYKELVTLLNNAGFRK